VQRQQNRPYCRTKLNPAIHTGAALDIDPHSENLASPSRQHGTHVIPHRKRERAELAPMSDAPAADAAQTSAAATQQPQENSPAAANGDAKSAAPADDGAKKLSPAELKKLAKAEKQARRAQAKGPATAPNQQGSAKDGQKQSKDSKQPPKDDKARPMPLRRRPSQSQSNAPVQKEIRKEPKKESKQAGIGLFFGHLYSQPKQQSMIGASKDVHPAVLSLGLQFSSYAICGSTARMVAMLLSFKAVIESYQTPPGTSLARHLTNHHLSPQIEYLRSCRPLSISMGNAIRWLKDSKLCILSLRRRARWVNPTSI
jgi:translation initiation factor eIF-2B subunit delta